MLRGLVRGQLHAHDKVGGVASGGEGPASVARLVERDDVRWTLRDVVPLARL